MLQNLNFQFWNIYTNYLGLAPKLLIAIGIVLLGLIISYISFFIVIWLIKILRLRRIIERLSNGNPKLGKQDIGDVIARSVAVFIFILIFRKAVVYLGFNEVENFLSDLISYLPKLFIGLLIGFFGIRFSDSVHGWVMQLMHFSEKTTANLLALSAKVVILFLTFMIALHYIQLVDDFIINSILIGFIAMISLAGGIAFGLGGKDYAANILGKMKKNTKLDEEKIIKK